MRTSLVVLQPANDDALPGECGQVVVENGEVSEQSAHELEEEAFVRTKTEAEPDHHERFVGHHDFVERSLRVRKRVPSSNDLLPSSALQVGLEPRHRYPRDDRYSVGGEGQEAEDVAPLRDPPVYLSGLRDLLRRDAGEEVFFEEFDEQTYLSNAEPEDPHLDHGLARRQGVEDEVNGHLEIYLDVEDAEDLGEQVGQN